MVSCKKGISSIVATVMVVLVVVVAISAVWTFVLPMVRDGTSEFTAADVNLRVISEEGYTVYDPNTDLVLVQVSRGSDDLDVVAMDIIISFNGSSARV